MDLNLLDKEIEQLKKKYKNTSNEDIINLLIENLAYTKLSFEKLTKFLGKNFQILKYRRGFLDYEK